MSEVIDMPGVVVVDYGMGNLLSVRRGFEHLRVRHARLRIVEKISMCHFKDIKFQSTKTRIEN